MSNNPDLRLHHIVVRLMAGVCVPKAVCSFYRLRYWVVNDVTVLLRWEATADISSRLLAT